MTITVVRPALVNAACGVHGVIPCDNAGCICSGEPDLNAGFTVHIPAKHVAEFKELVFRATNLWPDSSAAIKTFADEVIHGKVLQNYEEQYRPIKGTHRS